MLGLGKLFGIGISDAVTGIAEVVDKFVETDDEKRLAEQIRARMIMKPQLAQVEINKIEAAHRSIFVAGWRPFIGWVCGCALAWRYIGFDLLNWVALLVRPEFVPPKLDGTADLIAIVMSLLGLGGLRTFEKLKDKSK